MPNSSPTRGLAFAAGDSQKAQYWSTPPKPRRRLVEYANASDEDETFPDSEDFAPPQSGTALRPPPLRRQVSDSVEVVLLDQDRSQSLELEDTLDTEASGQPRELITRSWF